MVFKIAVCGSGKEPDQANASKARELGKEIASQGAVLLTGAGTGLPFEAVKGAGDANGTVKGISPAGNEKEHIEKYGFPIDGFGEIEYTGNGIPGRNFDLVEQSDAIIVIGGMVGTLNELTIALIEHKVVGILEGTGGIADRAREIIEIVERGNEKVIYSPSKSELVEKILQELGKN